MVKNIKVCEAIYFKEVYSRIADRRGIKEGKKEEAVRTD